MTPETIAFLRTTAALVAHVQAFPTDTGKVKELRRQRAAAEVAWVQAGTPDLPAESVRPSVVPPNVGKGEEKDWTREEFECEVVRTTDKALLLRVDGRDVWCPRSVLVEGERLEEGDEEVLRLPRWVLP